ncbi:MAG: hypothetical protein HY703_02045 [Gemmatimonadetes bacterium]|nr:hypothetical protein [Gemmatimonadota bacterium]
MNRQRPRARCLLLLLAVGACGSLTDSPAPAILEAELSESGPLVRTLRLRLEQPAPVTVIYGTNEGKDLRVHSPAASTHSILLARLRAGRTYEYRVAGTALLGTFQTESLPADLAQIGFKPWGRPSVPLVLLHLFNEQGFRGYVAVDAEGEVVWYWRTRHLLSSHEHLRRWAGRFTLHRLAGGGRSRSAPMQQSRNPTRPPNTNNPAS